MQLDIRKAAPEDLSFLDHLEREAFLPHQRNAKKNLARAITSDFQDVLIAESTGEPRRPVGALILFKYRKTLRIYSIATLPECQGQGVGDALLHQARELATRNGYQKLAIEARADHAKLLAWYAKRGFQKVGTLPDYYGPGHHAVKMELKIDPPAKGKKMSNVIVINQPITWTFPDVNAKVISVKEYINNPVYHSDNDLRIFNLCSSYRYQSYGYYVSLLASARGQRIIPSTLTIRDFKIFNVIKSVAYDVDEAINKALRKVNGNDFSLHIYFGRSNTKGYNGLARKLYQLFEAPLFEVHFVRHDKWMIKDMKVLSINKLPEQDLAPMYAAAKKYFSKKRFNKTKLVNYKYDIAILVDPSEDTPPSCPRALKKFKEMANRRGLYVEFITRADADKINEFDALFIRATTNVNDYTYEFSRMAYAEGLVVMDDPWSILKCSNKIYQNEIFRKHKILTPATTIFTKNLFTKKDLEGMNFPLVLKQPDSAFSLGITKVATAREAADALRELFKKSDMVVCQEFLYSDFDWRIGIMNNQAIFACKYYMSKGHWQIYNWKGEAEETSGDSETLPIEAVPAVVVKTALKAAALIGDGLYGVDLKMIDGKVYVVEVNDNPNIDVGIEDVVLGDKLYALIIDALYDRIEVAKNIRRIDFGRG
ncbi:GNAT family N-acetyltransferase [Neolewinella lacunae]|uniref:GNAT family N-acetyltransferase n=1 Tax=Neolewinella lacunae TaxID=1517758 RepID=A0A923PH24_9BACT|nr:GNAT family N-acetyltransferase [Neolewinella lacunae]MBC6993932.1 GNAT family N-acetyltransferase [Neolewinella lacunae]MDN3634987.1 GNAT family N-acetyltransferase [Neolewinella lacunae]